VHSSRHASSAWFPFFSADLEKLLLLLKQQQRTRGTGKSKAEAVPVIILSTAALARATASSTDASHARMASWQNPKDASIECHGNKSTASVSFFFACVVGIGG
jgi:hypothetical protein